jgi:4-hydroxy-tetrahydrodipicolinate reductase
VIDFSSPEAMTALASAAIAQPHGTRLPVFVVGSTGWTKESLALLDALAKRTPVLMASNFSTGVLALQEILKTAAPMLKRLGYTPVLVDTHHRHKKDAPSGTARTLQRIISPDNDVQTHSVRAGEVIGDHEITFYGPGDHLTLGHFAQDRSIFARGAIDCALWMASHRDKTVKAGALIDISAFFSSTGGAR